jgi:hypothetical protein
MKSGGFSISRYHNTTEIYSQIDQLIGQDIRPVHHPEMEKRLRLNRLTGKGTAAVFLLFIKERPKNIPEETVERIPFYRGIKHIVRNRDMIIMLMKICLMCNSIPWREKE